jgi:hypothetical protein
MNKVKERFAMLWIGASLPIMQQICLSSYIYNNQEIDLYVYDEVIGIPPGVNVLDASEIVPRSKIFLFQEKYSAFSNYFRYVLLLTKDVLWVDADHLSLSSNWGSENAEYFFGIQSYDARHDRINNGVLKYPKNSELAIKMLEDTEYLLNNNKNTVHGQTGPNLLSKNVLHFGLDHFAINREKIYPIGWGIDDSSSMGMPTIDDLLNPGKLSYITSYLKQNNSFSLTFWNSLASERLKDPNKYQKSFFNFLYQKYILKGRKKHNE